MSEWETTEVFIMMSKESMRIANDMCKNLVTYAHDVATMTKMYNVVGIADAITEVALAADYDSVLYYAHELQKVLDKKIIKFVVFQQQTYNVYKVVSWASECLETAILNYLSDSELAKYCMRVHNEVMK